MTIDLGGVVLHLVHNINLVRRPQEQLQTSSVKPCTTNGATVRGRRGCAHLLGTDNTVSNDLELAERGLICAWLTGGVHGLGVGRSKERNRRRQGADVGPVRTIHNGAGQIKSGAVERAPQRLSQGRVEGRGTGKGSNKIERGLYTPRRPLERDADREAARAGRSSMRRDCRTAIGFGCTARAPRPSWRLQAMESGWRAIEPPGARLIRFGISAVPVTQPSHRPPHGPSLAVCACRPPAVPPVRRAACIPPK